MYKKDLKFKTKIFISVIGGMLFFGTLIHAKSDDLQRTPITTAEPQVQTAKLPLSVVYKPVSENPKIGDAFLVNIHITLSPEITLNEIEYGEKLGDWEITTVAKGQVNCEGEKCERIDQLTLVSYTSGTQEVASIPFGFKTTDGKVGEFRPIPLSIKVDGLPGKPDEQPGTIRGLKAPQSMVSWIIVLVIVLTISLTGLGLWFYQKRKQQALVNQPTEPPRPAEEVAREHLDLLRKQNLIENGAGKAYYVELIAIFRQYIEGRFLIPAIDMTTHELHRELRRLNIAKSDVVRIKALLDYSDLVKFAKAEADLKEADEHWQLVWTFVEKTTQIIPIETLEQTASVDKPE